MVKRVILAAAVAIGLFIPFKGEAQARRWRPRQLTEVGGIRPEGDPLLAPLRAIADDSSIYVFDNGDMRLKAFDWRGRLRWAIGRKGAGPGEFEGVTGLSQAPDGRMWLYDSGTLRVTVVTSAGLVQRSFRPSRLLLPGGAVPIPEGRFLGQISSTNPFLALFDSLGNLLRELDVPKDFVGRNVIETHIVGDRSGSRALYGALHTDHFFLVNETGDSAREYRGVQRMEFPKWYATKVNVGPGKKADGIRPAAGNESGAVGVLMSGGLILVLLGSVAEKPFQTVDVYEAADGQYRESFLLPTPCTTLTSHADRLVCLRLDPVPEVIIWSMRSSEAP